MSTEGVNDVRIFILKVNCSFKSTCEDAMCAVIYVLLCVNVVTISLIVQHLGQQLLFYWCCINKDELS